MKHQKIKGNKENKENISEGKMIIKLKEDTVNEIIKDEEKNEKKLKSLIFNNKKNNNICSNLLKSVINNEKQLLVIPYPKEKQKKVKTLNEIGRANGISYPDYSVIKGVITEFNNYKEFLRGDDDNKYNSKTHKLTLSRLKYNTAKIDL